MSKWFRLFSLLFLMIGFSSAQAASSCNELLGGNEKPASSIDHTVPSGIVKHGEHLVDLLFGQAGAEHQRYLSSFETLVNELLGYARDQRVPRVNEKIDGSPSVVLGYAGEKPFITYKADFAGNKNQRLVTSPEVALEGFKPELAQLYSDAISLFSPVMSKVAQSEFQNFIFQGDLLFSPGDARIVKTPEKISILANTVTYEVVKGSPYFEAISKAKIGIVLHTFGRRIVGSDGRLSIAPTGSSDTKVIEAFIQKITSDDVFVISPWQDGVNLSGDRVSPGVEAEVQSLLKKIRTSQTALSSEFKAEWAARHEKRMRIFFNSYLKAPSDGGFYLNASKGRALDVQQVLADFNAWLEPRLAKGTEPKIYQSQWDQFVKNHGQELQGWIESYHQAVRIQYLLAPYLRQMFQSKLGGGEVEGVMLQTPETIVKLVDRLDFTLRNNLRNHRAVLPVPSVESGSPFSVWNPGALYIVMKGQPIHSGHLQMIKQTVARHPGKEIYLLVSDKSPNLQATEWKELKLADTKKALAAREYVYLFDTELRKQILKASVGDLVKVHFGSPNEFWSYVERANTEGQSGKVKLVVGQKEMDEGRYTDLLARHANHLEAEVIEMQEGGISATQVRAALKSWNLGSPEEKKTAYAFLNQAYSEIDSEATRKALIDQMLKAWRLADETSQKLITQ